MSYSVLTDINVQGDTKPDKSRINAAVRLLQSSPPQTPDWQTARDVVLFSVTVLAAYYAGRYASVTQRQLRSDLFQEGCIAALEAAQAFNPDYGKGNGSFTGFASVYMRRAMQQYLRAEFQPANSTSYSSDLSSAEGHPIQSHVMVDNAASPELLVELRDLVQTSNLTDKERTIITLIYWNGLKEADAARHLNISRERVRQLHRSGIERLRKLAGHDAAV